MPIHEASRRYNRAGFLRNENRALSMEHAELGPLVAGKKLLHLRCHFRMDTIN
ncbi:MAG: hypothetical protein IPI73_12640 [Betaproteobacteria bacterium]|nr:hypothetical protein [Betaproteobacteria bacterium]